MVRNEPAAFKNYTQIFIGALIFLLTSLAASIYPMLVLTLLIAAPPFILVIAKKTRFTGLLIILFLSPFLGVVKGITGVRYAPLLLDLALLLLVIFVLLDEIFARSLKISLMALLVMSFLILGLVQTLNSNVPSFLVGLEGYRATAFQATAFFAGYLLVKSKRDLQRIMTVLIATSAAVGLYGIKQFFLPSVVDQKIIDSSAASSITYMVLGKMRAFSTLSGPFHLGIFMVLAILLVIKLRLPQKIIYRLPIIAILVTSLILTITRSNWLAMVGAVSFLTVVSIIEKKEIASIKPVVISIAIFAAAFSLIYMMPDKYSDPALNYLTSLGEMRSTDRYMGTIENWRLVIVPALAENPFGYGTGSAGDGINERFIKRSFTSHNVLLKMALELGLLGMFIFSAILYLLFIKGFSVLRKLESEFCRNTAIWIMAFVFAVVVAGFSTPITDAYPANLYFWLLIGVLLNLKNIEEAEAIADEV